MGTRKELNKYIPPDFDPKKIPRIRKPKNQQKKVRTMVPFRTIRCNTCGNYISGGTKFNCREEQVIGQTYLGIKFHRFYIKCTKCCAELVYRTDPQNSDYVVESGATRIYDQHREEKLAEEGGDEMISLEKRASVSKIGFEVMAALGELKSMKARRMSVTVDTMLEALKRKDKEEEEKEDALLIKSIRFGRQRKVAEEETDEKKRILEPADEKKPKTKKRLACGKSPIQLSSVRILTSKKEKKTTSMGLTSLSQNYGTDEED